MLPTLTATSLTPRRELALLLTLAGIQFTHILDFMIMMPLGPQFRALFGITDAQFGLLVSAYTLAAGTSGLLASTYIDRFSRNRLLIALYTLFGLATLACGLAPGYVALMVARIAAGLFGGVLSALCQTIVADVIPFERRGRAMGIVMTAFSVSTVAGVPLGLFLAATFSWHAPFFAIAGMCAVLVALAGATLPPLDAHMQGERHSTIGGLKRVLADRNHQRSFLFTALLMSAGFTVIPYLTLYLQANAGFNDQQIPYIYLCGGAVTLVSARLFGRMTDRYGKVPTFRVLALANLVPLVGVTLVGGAPMAVVLVTTTFMFMLMSGRMIPGMSIITSSAEPRLRGTFMTLNTSVQSAAIGLASVAGGLLIHRDAQGHVMGYWHAALVGVALTLAAVWLAPRITLHGATAPRAEPSPMSKS
ncbi:MAG: MFS transporter [Burkholderiales bacterium]|nr:MFS transporter [Burkholderiales bacterium]